jgi:hypothetical protein
MSLFKNNNYKKRPAAKGAGESYDLKRKEQTSLSDENYEPYSNHVYTGLIQTNQDIRISWKYRWQDIEAEVGGLIKNLHQAYSQWQTSLKSGLNPAQSNAEWYAYLTNFRSEISLLNIRVSDYNKQVPLSTMQKPPFIANSIINQIPDQAGR